MAPKKVVAPQISPSGWRDMPPIKMRNPPIDSTLLFEMDTVLIENRFCPIFMREAAFQPAHWSKMKKRIVLIDSFLFSKDRYHFL